MFDLSEKTNNNDLNAKLLNDRLIRSVSEVIQREVEEYLSERLKDYSLYKDAYEQIMTISTTNNSSSPTCLELKKEIEDLKEQLNEYRKMFELSESDQEAENISLSIDENLVPDVSQIKFVEPVMPRNLETERNAFWNTDDTVLPRACSSMSLSPKDYEELNGLEEHNNKEESPEDEEEEGQGDEEEEEEEEEDEEEEVYEITISGKKYYTTDEKKKNGDIFEILPDEDVGPVIGRFKNGKCHFI